jgi:heme/copper-type cytochrome/quinol oxidase subunit 4
MKEIVFVLSAFTSLTCAVMLLRGYAKSRAKFLLWSGLCFVGLTLNNVFLYIDLAMYPEADLFMLRNLPTLVGLLLLLYGLIWDTK